MLDGLSFSSAASSNTWLEMCLSPFSYFMHNSKWVFFWGGGLTIIIIPKTGFPGCSPNIPISPQGSGKFTCLCLLESGKILQHTLSNEIWQVVTELVHNLLHCFPNATATDNIVDSGCSNALSLGEDKADLSPVINMNHECEGTICLV